MAEPSEPVIIKKYANRRLYDTESSSYITLDRIAQMTRAGRDFKVVDAKTGEDITRSVLTQIIMEEEARGETMLPLNFLRQIIAMYGGSMQAAVPDYLEAAMDAFRRNQSQLQESMTSAMKANPFAEIAKRNMEMFAAAAGLKATPPAEDRSEIAELKAQLAALQQKIDKLTD